MFESLIFIIILRKTSCTSFSKKLLGDNTYFNCSFRFYNNMFANHGCFVTMTIMFLMYIFVYNFRANNIVDLFIFVNRTRRHCSNYSFIEYAPCSFGIVYSGDPSLFHYIFVYFLHRHL